MSNPARLLADLLDRWRVPKGQAVRAIRDLDAVDHGFWRMQKVAVGLLSEVEDALDAMAADGRDVEHYRETVPAWFEAIFVTTLSWDAGADARSNLAPGDMRMLKALAQALDDIGWSPTVTSADLDNLRQAVDAAETLIRTDGALDRPVRTYLLGLIHEARTVIDEFELYGDVAVRSISMTLGGAMVVSAGTDTAKKQPGFSMKLATVGIRVLGSIGVNLASHGAVLGLDAGLNEMGILPGPKSSGPTELPGSTE